MLVRLILKMLFKATVPLVALVGMLTYGVYLQGGDPAALWKHVGNGAFGKASAMFVKAKNQATDVAGSLTAEPGSVIPGGSRATQVFTWTDENGTTHFGSSAPVGIDSQALTIDPDRNMLAAVPVPVAISGTRHDSRKVPVAGAETQGTIKRTQGTAAVRDLEAQMGEPLPGIAGHLLSGGKDGKPAVDATQLLQILQSSGM